jgi:HEAT repeat protein
LEAIAVRAYNLHQLEPPQPLEHPELESTLFGLAADEDAKIRWRAAYALGQMASPSAIKRLEGMVGDPDAETRYNAAVGLAQHGNAAGVETLAEMLDLDEMAGISSERNDANRQIKRTMLIGSAIGAAHALASQNSKADLSAVVKALERIATADPGTLKKSYVEPHLASEAERALQTLRSGK